MTTFAFGLHSSLPIELGAGLAIAINEERQILDEVDQRVNYPSNMQQPTARAAIATLLALVITGCSQSGVKPKPFAEILAREVTAADQVLEKPNFPFLKDPCRRGLPMVSGVGAELAGSFSEKCVSKKFNYPAVSGTYVVATPIIDDTGALYILAVRKPTTSGEPGKSK